MIGTLLAALVACVAAALLGGSSVAQRRAMPSTSDDGSGERPGLLATLVRSRWWWAGTLASVGGLALQLLALSFGSIIVVQTTMTSSILWTTLIEWALLGRRPGGRSWLGVGLTAAGLLTVLLALAPTTGPAGSLPTATVTLVLAAGCAVVMAAAAGIARRGSASRGALGLAVATGLGYGVTAIALKAVTARFGAVGSGLLAEPALWVALVLGPVSVLLSQRALRAWRAVIAVVAVILVVDPLVGLVAGTLWFGERIATSPGAIVAACAGAASLVAGIGLIQGTGQRRAREVTGGRARMLRHRRVVAGAAS